MTITVLDPTFEDAAAASPAPDRLETLRGASVAVISNGKQGTRAFFEGLADALINEHGVAEVHQLVKSNYSAPADTEVMDEATRWSAVVSGIGD